MNYASLPTRLLYAMDTFPTPRAQMVRRGGKWEEISSQEFLRRVSGLANALVELGVKAGDRVGLFAPNCPEWHTADFAVNGSGGVTVPVYFNESPERGTYILNHCGAQVVVVAGAAQFEKFLKLRDGLKDVQHVIVAGGREDLPADYLRYETLIAGAGDKEVAEYRARAARVTPEQ